MTPRTHLVGALAGLLLAMSLPADGAMRVTLEPGDRLTFELDADDEVVLGCRFFDAAGDRPAGRYVTHRDALLPVGDLGEPVPCEVVAHVEVVATGAFPNLIDFIDMVADDFTALETTRIVPGPGDDTVAGSFADDTFVWNNGDNTDLVVFADAKMPPGQGPLGDRVIVNGAGAGDLFRLGVTSLLPDFEGTFLRFERTNLIPFAVTMKGVALLEINGLGGDDAIEILDLGDIEDLRGLRLRGGPGDDEIDASALPAGVLPPANGDCTEPSDDPSAASPFEGLILCGGDGNDVLFGSRGRDFLDGGSGHDLLIGGPGDDTLLGGSGDDVNIWNNGDNSDVFDGGAGSDRQIVNGAAAGDSFTITAGAQPGSASFVRSNLIPFSVTMAAVEALEVNALDGADVVTTQGLPGITQFLDGGQPDAFPGDALAIQGFAGDLANTPVVELPGAGAISHVNFEFAPAGGPGLPEPRAVPSLGTAGLLAMVLALLAVAIGRLPRA
jgi:hypothetical protein